MTAEQLKNSILQYAVQGKLVEQNPADEPAALLLERIRTEKEQLIKEKKIRKEKPLLPITEEEIPFELPESWEWVRLGEIGTSNIGLTYKPSNISDEGIPVLRSNNIQNGVIDLNNLVKVKTEIKENVIANKGDILICARNGSKALVGKSAIIELEGMAFGAFMTIFRSNFNKYINKFINSLVFRQQLVDANTTTINQITQSMLRNIICPFPPLAEQEQIVAKIEELMPLVEEYGKAEQELNELNSRFPEQIKKSVLQYAIQGKLSEQNPADEPASILLKRICKEKEQLIKEKKIRKEKPLPPITEEEIPFEIPESWEWVRLGEVTHNFGQKKPDKDFSYIDVGSINNTQGTLSDIEKILTKEEAPSRARKIVKKGCVLYSTVRPYLLNICIVDKDFTHEPIASTAFAVLNPLTGLNKKYLFYILRSSLFIEYVNSKMIGVAYPAINDANLLSGLIPLPPLAEQERIVAKVEEVLEVCEGL